MTTAMMKSICVWKEKKKKLTMLFLVENNNITFSLPKSSWSSRFIIFHYHTINYFAITTKIALQWILSTFPTESADKQLPELMKIKEEKCVRPFFCFVKCHIIKKKNCTYRRKGDIALFWCFKNNQIYALPFLIILHVNATRIHTHFSSMRLNFEWVLLDK